MFQPFSQENPANTGTGLGLAIVNSIVRSEGLNGKVEVFSTEGAGTEISFTFEVEPPSQKSSARSSLAQMKNPHLRGVKVSMVGFDEYHRGQTLLKEVLSSYLTGWWGAELAESRSDADVMFINDKLDLFMDLVHREDIDRPVLFLTAVRGNPQVASVMKSFEQLGGRCFLLYKPCRPSNLFVALERALYATSTRPPSTAEDSRLGSRRWRSPSVRSISPNDTLFARPSMSHRTSTSHTSHSVNSSSDYVNPAFTRRRYSDDDIVATASPRRRPHIQRRFTTVPEASPASSPRLRSPSTSSQNTRRNSIPVKDPRAPHPRVLIVEDNYVNRTLFTQWLKKKVCPLFTERLGQIFDMYILGFRFRRSCGWPTGRGPRARASDGAFRVSRYKFLDAATTDHQ